MRRLGEVYAPLAFVKTTQYISQQGRATHRLSIRGASLRFAGLNLEARGGGFYKSFEVSCNRSRASSRALEIKSDKDLCSVGGGGR